MIDVHLPTTDGRLIDRLELALPAQSPPKITAAALAKRARRSEDLLI